MQLPFEEMCDASPRSIGEIAGDREGFKCSRWALDVLRENHSRRRDRRLSPDRRTKEIDVDQRSWTWRELMAGLRLGTCVGTKKLVAKADSSHGLAQLLVAFPGIRQS